MYAEKEKIVCVLLMTFVHVDQVWLIHPDSDAGGYDIPACIIMESKSIHRCKGSRVGVSCKIVNNCITIKISARQFTFICHHHKQASYICSSFTLHSISKKEEQKIGFIKNSSTFTKNKQFFI